jgi:hypothetical protein
LPRWGQATPDKRLAKLNILGRIASGCHFNRPGIAQEFFDGGLNEVRVTPQQGHLVGMLQQGRHAIANEIDRCFMTGHDEQSNHIICFAS